MGTISGWLRANCNKCRCSFWWTAENWPFVNAEFIGTCNKCVNEEAHECEIEV